MDTLTPDELIDLLAAGRCADPRVAAKLERAAKICRETGESFGVLLGIEQRQDSGPIDYARRNDFLRRAWGLLDAGPLRARGKQLNHEINKFWTVFWPKWSALPYPPDDASELRAALFWAMIAGRGFLPTGWRQLADICAVDPEVIAQNSRNTVTAVNG